MAEGANANTDNFVDPVELWRQWNETTTTLWTRALESSKQVYDSGAPWLKSLDEAQEQSKLYPVLFSTLKEIWQTWFDATMEIWRQSVNSEGERGNLAAQWLKMMEEAQAKLQAGEVLPIDPFTLFRDWYNTSSEEWARSVESILGSEKFLQSSGPLVESYISVMRAFRLASEAYFKRLQLPTLSDIARVAELVIALEEKVDKVQDEFEDLAQQYNTLASRELVANVQERLNALASGEMIAELQERLNAVASREMLTELQERFDSVASREMLVELHERLNALASGEMVAALQERLNAVANSEMIAGLQEQLNRMASNEALEGLAAQVQQLSADERVSQLEQRLSRLEEKLDRVLTHLEQSTTEEASAEPANQGKKARARKKVE